jgi:hypothetical protein
MVLQWFGEHTYEIAFDYTTDHDNCWIVRTFKNGRCMGTLHFANERQ